MVCQTGQRVLPSLNENIAFEGVQSNEIDRVDEHSRLAGKPQTPLRVGTFKRIERDGTTAKILTAQCTNADPDITGDGRLLTTAG